MNLQKILCSFLLGMVLVGCASTESKSPEQIVYEEERSVIQKFEDANRLLDDKQYEAAAKAFDQLRVANPTSQLDYFIIFNAGIAYQSMNDCVTAAERYRQVIRLTSKLPKTQTLARLRLGDTLICMGDDKKAMVTLVEVYNNRKHLTPEVGEAEVPARLAAAYAREGNKKMAERYFKLAEAGLAKVRASKNMPKDQRDIMARTLFLMGNMGQLNPKTLTGDDYLTTVKSLQKYLYQAVEMNVSDWSQEASRQIIEAYDKAWHYLDAEEAVTSNDKLLDERRVREKKIALANAALAGIKGIYSTRVPSPDEPQIVKDLMSELRKQEAKIEGFIALNSVGNLRTEEAKKLESVKREGRFKK